LRGDLAESGSSAASTELLMRMQTRMKLPQYACEQNLKQIRRNLSPADTPRVTTADTGPRFTHEISHDNGWLGSRVISVLQSGAEGPGFKSQPRRCRVTVLGKLFTPIVPLFTKQRNW